MVLIISLLALSHSWLHTLIGVEGNLLKNGDFESIGGQAWSEKRAPGVDILVDTSTFFSGKRSLRIENRFMGQILYYGCNQDIDAPAHGSWLTLRTAIKAKNLTGQVGIDIHFIDNQGARLPVYDTKIALNSYRADRDWETYSIDLCIPEKTKSITVAIFLRGTGTVWFDKVSLWFSKLPAAVNNNPSKGAYLLRNENPKIWFEFAEQKVYHNTSSPQGKVQKTIDIYSARNECEPFQIVLNSKVEATDYAISFTDLKNTSTGIITKQCLSYYVVGYVDVSSISTPTGTSGSIPDFLLPVTTFRVPANKNTAIWINLEIPESTTPGIYTGEIIVKRGGDIITRIPLKVTIWDFVLPATDHLYMLSDVWLPIIQKYDNRNQERILADYYSNLKTHRVNVFRTINLETKIIRENLVCDFEKFDRQVGDLFENYGVEAVIIGPFIGNASGWKYRRKWMSIDPDSPQFTRWLKKYCMLLKDHLTTKGWLTRCWISYWDEPQWDDPGLERIIEIGKTIKKVAPSLNIFLTSWLNPRFYNIVDIWAIPFSNQDFLYDAIRERQALGERIFVYHNDPYIDTPLIDKRIYAWRYRLTDVDGTYAWWNLAFWQSNPYENVYAIEEQANGNKTTLKPGNGVLLYPNPAGAGAPVNSIRWEIFRQGLEDYEYFCILQHKIDKALTQLKKDNRFMDYSEHRILRIISNIVSDPFTTWKTDASFLYELRRRLAEEIQRINQAPIVFLTSEPSKTRNNTENSIRILGLTMKGTRITINGKAVHVHDDGTFVLEAMPPNDGYFLLDAQMKNKRKIMKYYLF